MLNHHTIAMSLAVLFAAADRVTLPATRPPSLPVTTETTPAVTLANGVIYRLPASYEPGRVLLSNRPELLARQAVPLSATLAYQHLVEAGEYMNQREPAVELAAIGLRLGGAGPLILDYEREGSSAEAHANVAGVVRIARSHAPMRAVGAYSYPKLPYRKANSVALAELVIERDGYAGMTKAWGEAALPKYELALQSAKPTPQAEAPLAAAADFACPSLYVPAGYGGDPERVYRACARLIAEARRWNKPVVAFISPSYSGYPQADKGLLPPAERDAVLRACRDAGATPLLWLGHRAPPNVIEAARQMSMEWRNLGPPVKPPGTTIPPIAAGAE